MPRRKFTREHYHSSWDLSENHIGLKIQVTWREPDIKFNMSILEMNQII